MVRMKIEKEYFDWMYDMVCAGRFADINTFRKLLRYLHDVEFTYYGVNDADRAHDGVGLRRRFALLHPEDDYDYIIDRLGGPCSILEMMIALAIRCEETIMVDPRFGDRTAQWFWKMIVNLGLGSMTDTMYDYQYVEDVVVKFLTREYEPDGHGSLFRVRDSEYDFRELEIWNQLCCFLDTII